MIKKYECEKTQMTTKNTRKFDTLLKDTNVRTKKLWNHGKKVFLDCRDTGVRLFKKYTRKEIWTTAAVLFRESTLELILHISEKVFKIFKFIIPYITIGWVLLLCTPFTRPYSGLFLYALVATGMAYIVSSFLVKALNKIMPKKDITETEPEKVAVEVTVER